MASIMRPSVLRQTCSLASATRSFSTKPTFASTAFRTSVLCRTRPMQSAFVPYTSPRIAAFHATGVKALLPALPQRVEGTVNDAAHVPATSPSHGSYHWSFERVVAAALVPLTVAPFAAGSVSPTIDAVLISLILIHSHIGFEACIIDYLPKYRVPKTHKGFMWLLKLATLVVAIGFYEFETNDVGVTEAVKRIWTAQK